MSLSCLAGNLLLPPVCFPPLWLLCLLSACCVNLLNNISSVSLCLVQAACSRSMTSQADTMTLYSKVTQLYKYNVCAFFSNDLCSWSFFAFLCCQDIFLRMNDAALRCRIKIWTSDSQSRASAFCNGNMMLGCYYTTERPQWTTNTTCSQINFLFSHRLCLSVFKSAIMSVLPFTPDTSDTYSFNNKKTRGRKNKTAPSSVRPLLESKVKNKETVVAPPAACWECCSILHLSF